MVKNTDNEYYLLENRQWNGWDIGLPGKGLVVYHVNYLASRWSGNTVNNTMNARNFHLIAADNRDYQSWDDYLIASGAKTQYASSGHMNNLHLSGAPYPLANEEEILNDSLTDTSVPASIVYQANPKGALFMSKSITDIVQHDDGTVSFKFMGGDSIPDGIISLTSTPSPKGDVNIFDLQGRRVNATYRGLVISNGKLKLQ
jgi:hypothetical protein